jgi:cell division protein FtsB
VASRPRQREFASSLFPFLSVLACLIGTLTLLIAALALGQVAQDLLDESDAAAEQVDLSTERAVVRKLVAKLEREERLAEERGAAAAELRALGIHPEQPEARRQQQVDTRLSAARLARRLAKLEAEAADMDSAIGGARVALVSERAGDDVGPIRILPQGSARPLLPFFVECRKEGFRLYHKDLKRSFYLSRGVREDVEAFRAYLQRVRNVRDGTVIFLIRPDGIDSYRWAASQTGRAYVRHAKLPLPGQGELEFAL